MYTTQTSPCTVPRNVHGVAINTGGAHERVYWYRCVKYRRNVSDIVNSCYNEQAAICYYKVLISHVLDTQCGSRRKARYWQTLLLVEYSRRVGHTS
jgi:hypothetical protein